MTKDMSVMTNENLKSYIVADRMTILNAIAKDCSSVSSKDAANWLKTFRSASNHTWLFLCQK